MTRLFIAALATMALLLTGCAAGTSATKTTVTDPATGRVTITEPTVEDGFFESGNLNKYYEFEGKRADKHAEVAQKKIGEIIKAGNAAMQNYATPVERAQGALLTQMLIAQVPVTPPPDGIAAPKTMTEMFDRNLIPLLSTGLQAYGLIWGNLGNSASSADMTISSSGTGSVFVNSSGNSLQDYKLSADGDAGYISGIDFSNGLTYTPATTITETQGDSSYGLQLF